MIERTIVCGVCGKRETEQAPEAGWPGWGALQGIVLNGVPNPHLCPEHLIVAVKAIDPTPED